MPDRIGTDRYDGPERRKLNRRAEDRPPLKHGWFTTWQWAVIGTLLVAVALSASVGELARNADRNARRGNAAICVEIAFLENSAKTSEQLIRQNPGAPENPARAAGAVRVHRLIMQLRQEIPSCTEALR